MQRLTTVISATLLSAALASTTANALEIGSDTSADAAMETSSTTDTGASTSMEGSVDSGDVAAGASTSAGVDAAASQDFSDEDLQKFADASSEVAGITQDYSQQLQAETDVEAQQALQVEANQKISEAVQSSGLDVNTFNSIGMAVQQDPELLQRVQSMVQR